MTGAPVGVAGEIGDRSRSGSGALATIRRRREAMAMELAGGSSGWALEQLDDDEFQQLLVLDKRKEARVKEIVLNRLEKGTWEEGADYGVVPGISKPFCWESGADKIAKLFRWCPAPLGAPDVEFDGEILTVSCTVVILDLSGRQLVAVSRSCSTMEKRFKNKSSGKWKFDHPLEAVNECAAMAQKRAKIAAVLTAAGAKRYFANPEQLADADDDGKAEPWTDAEKKPVFAAARKVGITTADDFKAFVEKTLGRAFVGTGEDPKKLMTALLKMGGAEKAEPSDEDLDAELAEGGAR